MSLNIKNEDVHRLVQELAKATGESQTTAVLHAVQERLARLRRADTESLTQRLLAIGAECAAHMREPYLSIDHGDLLYGPDGLPR
jgi:antitoxin VapB